MIDTFEKTSGAVAPEGTHFVRARNGTFLRNMQWWVDATVPVERTKTLSFSPTVHRWKLLPEKKSATLLLPPLPAHILGKALKLSKRVCDMSKSEVCMLIFWSEGKGYQLYVPSQSVTPVSINYVPYGSIGREQYVGSIHSHGLLSAYHSGVDQDDEFAGNDGVHVTIGSLDAYPRFSLSAEIAINRHRFPVEPAWFTGLRHGGKSHALKWPDFDSWQIPPEALSNIVQLPLMSVSGAKL